MTRDLTFVHVDGDFIRVSITGEGRPLLLIMGLGGNIEMWAPLESALRGLRVQTIAYDAPGMGDSPARRLPLRLPGLASQAAHLLDTLGYPQVDALGVSFGGAVAQELAFRHPDRVRRLVLASTTCGLGAVPGNLLALAMLATPLRYYSPTFLRLTADFLYGPAPNGHGDLHQQQFNARRARPPTIIGYFGQLAAGVGWTSLPWLHRLRVPTLVLTGDSDRIVPAVNARILACRIPDARLDIVPNAGHLMLMDHAQICATTIADFLDH